MSSKHILIVDDSESIRELVSVTLSAQGYTVYKGVNGLDGVAQLSQITEKLSLIITDLFMPEMDGFGLVKEVRQNDKYKYVPIIMLTTESQIEKKLIAKKEGVTGWIEKPFDQDRLLKIVQKVIGKS
ncbi:two-component system, chemotaxis family, response regulator CheY [Reichenbachiella agariperforans]|uniref:Two-component system, chemotaxis family, response regulator CheY n=1 Tax=Reichenbachiella agariperforans TaxID=156994 RepID=A0A1M6T0R0_REIAG|nr:response regulator [Reichenbachiella agariperforans]SHK50531.1 two-component system, chemotaxis family, response regulator CheY [Reichenbachiella agariperforans]